MPKSSLNRRQFLNRSLAAAGAGFAIGGTRSTGRVIGANDTIRVAIAGPERPGRRARRPVRRRCRASTITYLVDPDTRTYDKRIHQIESRGGHAPSTVQDIRRVLDDKNVDAVTVATPNHWHALMTIWACQAGKDVYVEKPCSHNVHEGRIAVEAARQLPPDRPARHAEPQQPGAGPARRRGHPVGQARQAAGLAGALLQAARSIGFKPDTDAPGRGSISTSGSARRTEQPYHANLVHYNWHWFWDFGNGDIGNQGVHQMDIARWLIPGADGRSATYPKSVLSLGGRFGYRDQGQTANTQISVMDFGDTQLIFEVRGLKTGGIQGREGRQHRPSRGGNAHRRQVHPARGATRPSPCPSWV